MKTFYSYPRILTIFLWMYSVIASSQLNAQTIVIDSTFITDGEIFPFSQNDTIYGLSISGSVTLNSDTSLVRVILSDTVGNEWMVYEAYSLILPCRNMDLNNASQSKYRLAFTYWDNNQVNDAFDVLSDIPTTFDLTSAEQNSHQDYLEYFDILQMMKDSNFTARDIDSSSVQSLIAIMNNDHPLISAYARGILLKGNHINYTETVSFPLYVKSYPAYYYLDPRKFIFPEEEHLVLFPNPCGDFVVAYFNTIEKGYNGTIVLNDLQGKELDRIKLPSQQNQIVINLSNYPNGAYTLRLSYDNQLISSKLILKGRK